MASVVHSRTVNETADEVTTADSLCQDGWTLVWTRTDPEVVQMTQN